MMTEAKKRANKKYKNKNYKTVAFDCKIESVEKFKKYCERIGKSKNAVLNEFVEKCIGSLDEL